MTGFEHARARLAAEVMARKAAVIWVDISATEDGRSAMIYYELDDGETLAAVFDFGCTIDPENFDAGPYLEKISSNVTLQ